MSDDRRRWCWSRSTERVATVTFNRPQKRNAMNPALNVRMLEVLDELEGATMCGVVVLTGAGESWSAGMDLKEYFRDNDGKGRAATLKARRQSGGWWQPADVLRKAHHRHGQWLVLRRRLHAAGRLRSGDRRRGGQVRPVARSTGASCRAATSPAPSPR